VRRKYRAVGFWFNDGPDPNHYPLPQRLQGNWDPGVRFALIHYLRFGSVRRMYRGYSFCRFHCGIPPEEMGRLDLGDGDWLWPEGLAHYLEAHSVMLPEDFVRFAMASGFQTAHERGEEEAEGSLLAKVNYEVDDTPWIAWAEGRRACVHIRDPWVPLRAPNDLEYAKIEAELELELSAPHPLSGVNFAKEERYLAEARGAVIAENPKTKEHLFWLPDRRLAIVQLTWNRRPEIPPLPRTTFLSGWDEWED
jgi:hypothetical protein